MDCDILPKDSFMRKQLYLLLFIFFYVLSPSLSAEEKMPDTFRQWEQENKERESKEESRFEALWTKTLLLLVIILAVLFIATYFMKRFDRFKNKEPSQKSQIQLLERKVLSPKSVLYLIEVEGQK